MAFVEGGMERNTYHRDGGRSGEVGGGNAGGSSKHCEGEKDVVKGLVRGGEGNG